jgi:hypothetical protein
MHANMINSVLIPCIVIVVIALLLIWVVNQFLPEFSYPARMIIGLVAVLAVLYKLSPLLMN